MNSGPDLDLVDRLAVILNPGVSNLERPLFDERAKWALNIAAVRTSCPKLSVAAAIAEHVYQRDSFNRGDRPWYRSMCRCGRQVSLVTYRHELDAISAVNRHAVEIISALLDRFVL